MRNSNLLLRFTFFLALLTCAQGGSLDELNGSLRSGQCVALVSLGQIEFWVSEKVPPIIKIPKIPRGDLAMLYIFESLSTPRGATKHTWLKVIDGFVHVRPSKNGEMHYLIRVEEIRKFLDDPKQLRLKHEVVQPHELTPLLTELVIPARLKLE